MSPRTQQPANPTRRTAIQDIETQFRPRPWPATAALLLLLFLAHVPSLHAGFLWDDDWLILHNSVLRSASALRQIWFSLHSNPDYFPLTFSLFLAEFRAFADHPLGYHIVNLLLHAATTLLLHRLLLRLIPSAAFLAAAIWAIHPLNVATVAWVAEQKNLLCLPLMLLAGLLYLKDDGRSYAAACLCFILALLSKSAAVVLPPALLLLIWYREGAVSRRQFLRVAPLLVLSLASAGMTIHVQRHNVLGDAVIGPPTLFHRLALAGLATTFYLSKAVLPVGLTVIYPKWTPFQMLSCGLPLTVALLSAALLLFHYRARPIPRALLAALSLFLCLLLPVLGFFDWGFMAVSYVSDHYLYMPLAALCALAAAAVANLAPRARAVTSVAILAPLLLLGFTRSRLYAEPEQLWHDNLARNPAALGAHINLAKALAEQGRDADARAELETCLTMDPSEIRALIDLGLSDLHRGDFPAAESRFRAALDLRPHDAMLHTALATALAGRGDTPAAIASLRQALALSSDLPDAHARLGSLLARNRDTAADAANHLLRAAQLDPLDLDARLDLANCYESLARPVDAARAYRDVLRVNPNSVQALNDLAWLLATSPDDRVQDGRSALSLATRAAMLTHFSDPSVLDTLAAAQAESGKFAEAIATATRAAALGHSSRSLAAQIASHLTAYRAHTPWREPRN